MLPHDQNALVDDRLGARDRKVSKDARSRAHLADRLTSAKSHAAFAAAAAHDIFDGEPLDSFRLVNRLDETTLRFRAQELREQIVAHAMRQHAKRITG